MDIGIGGGVAGGGAGALDGAIDDALETVEQALASESRRRRHTGPRRSGYAANSGSNRGRPELAEADFREAIALAQKMGAKAWELRATMSLARMLARQGRRDEARTMLADIYNWFTEGFDTADLKDAKVLLVELAE